MPDAPGDEVAINDGINLISARRRLIDALRIERYHLSGLAEPIKEKLDGAFR